MALLVMGQRCQPCPGTDSAASLPVPPDPGEDTEGEGCIWFVRRKPLQSCDFNFVFPLKGNLVSGNHFGASAIG